MKNQNEVYDSEKVKEMLVTYISETSLYNQKRGREVAEEMWQKATSNCIVCNKAFDKDEDRHVALFEPNSSVEWGGIRGKKRLFIYSVCSRHEVNDELADEIEDKILADYSPFNNSGPGH